MHTTGSSVIFNMIVAAYCCTYRFTLLDLGQVGRFSDGGVLNNSSFGESLMRGDLPFPMQQPLPGTSGPDLPYVIVGDEAFPLRENMLRPYPGHNLPGILTNACKCCLIIYIHRRRASHLQLPFK